VLVNGEHRIKFIALRDINVGEELLFNYGKKFAEKQGLTKTLPKAKVGGKRGVLVGEEALDALDGMDQRKRVTRGKMNEIRGGTGGAGKGKGGKMRKTAASTVPVVEVPVGEDLYGAQPDEPEDEDEDLMPRRRKRKITRPARYTR
jgi:histone-lysine N-methyltransferase EZH2